jgi:hypothetical protein
LHIVIKKEHNHEGQSHTINGKVSSEIGIRELDINLFFAVIFVWFKIFNLCSYIQVYDLTYMLTFEQNFPTPTQI